MPPPPQSVPLHLSLAPDIVIPGRISGPDPVHPFIRSTGRLQLEPVVDLLPLALPSLWLGSHLWHDPGACSDFYKSSGTYVCICTLIDKINTPASWAAVEAQR